LSNEYGRLGGGFAEGLNCESHLRDVPKLRMDGGYTLTFHEAFGIPDQITTSHRVTENKFLVFEGGQPIVCGQLFTISVPSYTTYKINCVITPSYIWLHVSAVTRPSSGQQGIVLLRYIQLVFLMGSNCLH